VKRVRRRYRDGTLILETEFETEEGSATVLDLMPIYGEGTDLLRIVVGNRGRVPMRMELVIRFGYGSVVPWVQRIDGGIGAVAGPDCLGLHTPVGRTARTSRRWRTSLASTPRSPCRARPGAAMLRDGFVARYRTRSGVDGLPPGEGVFLPCSFWLAENYVLQGRIEEARSLFERLCGLANDVGLLSEEYDPAGQSASHDRFQRSGSPPTR